MPAVIKNLTPPVIPQIDYPVVQRPALGGEMDVFITSKPSRVLGILTVVDEGGGIASVTISAGGTGFSTGDAVTFTGGGGSGGAGTVVQSGGIITSILITNQGSGYTSVPSVAVAGSGTGETLVAVLTVQDTDYEFINTPNAISTGPILAVVKNELRADAAAVVTYAGISGIFQATQWARIQNSFNFPTGKSVELIGTFTQPLSTDVPTITNAKRGSTVVLLEMPFLADFFHVGCTNSKKIKFPVRGSKAIACQLESSKWTVPGKTEVGTLEVVGLSENPDDGLQRFAGLKSTAMLKTRAESKIETNRTFVTDWTPMLDQDSPEADNEATQTVSGLFSLVAVLVAPGTS